MSVPTRRLQMYSLTGLAATEPLCDHRRPLTIDETLMRNFAVIWALTGFTALLGAAVFRLSTMAMDSWSFQLQAVHYLVLFANLAFMAYSEGYRGFQKRFSPRFAQRLVKLKISGTTLQCLLAPFYCMNYFSAARRQLIVTYSLTLMIIVFILSFRYIPQPWRGILDAGVVLGLAWGIIATWSCSLSALLHPANDSMNTDPA